MPKKTGGARAQRGVPATIFRVLRFPGRDWFCGLYWTLRGRRPLGFCLWREGGKGRLSQFCFHTLPLIKKLFSGQSALPGKALNGLKWWGAGSSWFPRVFATRSTQGADLLASCSDRLADVARKLSQSAEAVQKRRDRKRYESEQKRLERRQANLSGPVKTFFVDPETLR
jgi:hypothetical protein